MLEHIKIFLLITIILFPLVKSTCRKEIIWKKFLILSIFPLCKIRFLLLCLCFLTLPNTHKFLNKQKDIVLKIVINIEMLLEVVMLINWFNPYITILWYNSLLNNWVVFTLDSLHRNDTSIYIFVGTWYNLKTSHTHTKFYSWNLRTESVLTKL